MHHGQGAKSMHFAGSMLKVCSENMHNAASLQTVNGCLFVILKNILINKVMLEGKLEGGK